MIIWDSIDDLPIFYYNKINETNDLRYLIKDEIVQKIKPLLNKSLIKAWDNVQKELYFTWKDELEYQNHLNKVIQLANYRIDGALNNDTLAKLNAKMIEHELNANKTLPFFDTVAVIHRKFNTFIDPKIMTVRFYFTYLKQIGKEK